MWSFKLSDDIDCTVTPLPRLADCRPSDSVFKLSPNLNEQEAQLVSDIYAVLLGGEGYFAQYDPSFDPLITDDRIYGPKYRIDSRVHMSFKEIVSSIAAFASADYAVRVFAETYVAMEYGSVLNAIACSFRCLHQQFLDLIAELETTNPMFGDLKLLKIYTHLLPFESFLVKAKDFVHSFLEVSKAGSRIVIGEEVSRPEKLEQALNINYGPVQEFKGGSILRLISDKLRNSLGDADAVNLYEQLLISGSKPYLQMLTKWLTMGSLNDPYDEFLIQKNSGHYVETTGKHFKEYWNRRFATRGSKPPLVFDNKEIQKKVLETGNFVSFIATYAVDETENRTSPTSPPWLEFSKSIAEKLSTIKSVEDTMLCLYIDEAYDLVNKAVIDMLKQHKYTLFEFLAELKDLYFFTGTGTTMDKFLSFADKELLKPINEIEDVALTNALSMALSPTDKWAQFISVSRAPLPLKETLTDVFLYHQGAEAHSSEGIGYDYVQIGFKPPFPLSIFVSERTMQRYQYISRFLLEIRRTHEIAQETWFFIMRSPEYRSEALVYNHEIQSASFLHARMTRFVSYLLTHCTVNGIEVFWSSFMKYCENAENVSDLEYEHNLYLNKSLDCCFLTKQQGMKYVLILLTTVKRYCQFVRSNEKAARFICSTVNDSDDVSFVEKRKATAEWFQGIISKFETSFEHSLKRLMNSMDDNVSFNGLADITGLQFKTNIRSLMHIS